MDWRDDLSDVIGLLNGEPRNFEVNWLTTNPEPDFFLFFG